MARRRAIISRNWFFYEQTNKSREILACRRQVLSREEREGERQRARVNTRRAKTIAKESALEVEEEDKI